MIEYTVVGLPFTETSMTEEFKDFIRKDNLVCVMYSGINWYNPEAAVGDYVKNKFAYDYLKENDFKYVSYLNYKGGPRQIIMLHDVWKSNDNIRVTGSIVAKRVEEYLSAIWNENYEYAVITGGSPHLGDYVCANLSPKRIIDTKSSLNLCEELFHSMGYNKPLHHVSDCVNYNIEKNSINAFMRMGESYAAATNQNGKLRPDKFPGDLQPLFGKITDDMDIYTVYFGQENEVIRYTSDEIKKKILEDRRFFNPRLLVLVTR